MTKYPVSILMPVKNAEKYIKDCIDSVICQSHKDFELIILDDSDDITSKIIKSYSDKRIKHLIVSGNISHKLNYGLQVAQYEFICRMDGDDIIDSRKLEKQISFLLDNPQIDVLGTNYFCINETGSILYEKRLPEYHKEIEFMMPFITSVLHSSIMLKKSKYLRITPYDETLNYAEDLDLFLKSLRILKYHNHQETLYYYRINYKPINTECNRISYLLGEKYLNQKYNSDLNNNETMFQIGLLEYYRNDIRKARKVFFKLLISSRLNKSMVIRYLIPALFGNNLAKLRKNGFLIKLNALILKYIHFDTYSIRYK
ncbi:MAG: glycosyltransferase [Ignavibacteriae bacterium]|nr:glycosyltransferase [Ignavibacteriota bacterium]